MKHIPAQISLQIARIFYERMLKEAGTKKEQLIREKDAKSLPYEPPRRAKQY